MMITMAHSIPISNQISQINTPNYNCLSVNKKLKRKRVTWAPDNELRQIRFFCIDDSPSLAGLSENKTNQAAAGSNKQNGFPDLPPGFESTEEVKHKQLTNRNASLLSFPPVVAQIPWRIPDLITLNPDWQVVAGGGSEEVLTQQEREKRSFEAFYPNFLNIPENPSDPLESQDEEMDDSLTPIIPSIPIEEEEEGGRRGEEEKEKEKKIGSNESDLLLKHSKLVDSISMSTPSIFPSISSSTPSSSSSSSSSSSASPSYLPPPMVTQTSASASSTIEHPALSLSDAMQSSNSLLSVIRENGSIDTNVLQSILSNDVELIKAANKWKSSNRPEFSSPPAEKPSPFSLSANIPTNKPLNMPAHQDRVEDSPAGNFSSGFFRPPYSNNSPFPPNPSHPPMHPPAHPSLHPLPPPFPDRALKPRERFFEEAMHPPDSFFGMDLKIRPNFSARGPPYPHSYPPRSPHPPHSRPPFFEGENGGMNPSLFDPVHENANRSVGKKLCAFFNSPRGCRNGNNCTFLHEMGEGKTSNTINTSKKRDRDMFDN